MDAVWFALAIVGLLAVLGLLLLAVWLVMARDRADERWPDHDATLDVQSHIGDSRPLR